MLKHDIIDSIVPRIAEFKNVNVITPRYKTTETPEEISATQLFASRKSFQLLTRKGKEKKRGNVFYPCE
jgi:hypothetical protein